MSDDEGGEDFMDDLSAFYGITLEENSDTESVPDTADDEQNPTLASAPSSNTVLDLNSPHFHVDMYLSELVNEPLESLQQQLTDIHQDRRELSAQMQTMVYENYSKFLSATDIIRSLNKTFVGLSTNLDSLDVHLQDVHVRSTAFQDEVDGKLQHATHLKSLCSLLDTLQFVFRLPHIVKMNIRNGQHRAALRAYTTARPILLDNNHPSFSSILHRTSKAILAMAQKIQADMPTLVHADHLSVIFDSAVLLVEVNGDTKDFILEIFGRAALSFQTVLHGVEATNSTFSAACIQNIKQVGSTKLSACLKACSQPSIPSVLHQCFSESIVFIIGFITTFNDHFLTPLEECYDKPTDMMQPSTVLEIIRATSVELDIFIQASIDAVLGQYISPMLTVFQNSSKSCIVHAALTYFCNHSHGKDTDMNNWDFTLPSNILTILPNQLDQLGEEIYSWLQQVASVAITTVDAVVQSLCYNFPKFKDTAQCQYLIKFVSRVRIEVTDTMVYTCLTLSIMCLHQLGLQLGYNEMSPGFTEQGYITGTNVTTPQPPPYGTLSLQAWVMKYLYARKSSIVDHGELQCTSTALHQLVNIIKSMSTGLESVYREENAIHIPFQVLYYILTLLQTPVTGNYYHAIGTSQAHTQLSVMHDTGLLTNMNQRITAFQTHITPYSGYLLPNMTNLEGLSANVPVAVESKMLQQALQHNIFSLIPNMKLNTPLHYLTLARLTTDFNLDALPKLIDHLLVHSKANTTFTSLRKQVLEVETAGLRNNLIHIDFGSTQTIVATQKVKLNTQDHNPVTIASMLSADSNVYSVCENRSLKNPAALSALVALYLQLPAMHSAAFVHSTEQQIFNLQSMRYFGSKAVDVALQSQNLYFDGSSLACFKDALRLFENPGHEATCGNNVFEYQTIFFPLKSYNMGVSPVMTELVRLLLKCESWLSASIHEDRRVQIQQVKFSEEEAARVEENGGLVEMLSEQLQLMINKYQTNKTSGASNSVHDDEDVVATTKEEELLRMLGSDAKHQYISTVLNTVTPCGYDRTGMMTNIVHTAFKSLGNHIKNHHLDRADISQVEIDLAFLMRHVPVLLPAGQNTEILLNLKKEVLETAYARYSVTQCKKVYEKEVQLLKALRKLPESADEIYKLIPKKVLSMDLIKPTEELNSESFCVLEERTINEIMQLIPPLFIQNHDLE